MSVLTEDMKRMIRQQRMGFIATVSPQGLPNLSPKGTMSVWDDDHLVFADLGSPDTIANLEQNPACEINVLDYFARKGYLFKGDGIVLVEGDLFNENHDAVTVETIIKVLMENASAAKQLVVNLIPLMKEQDKPCQAGCHTALDVAVITAPEARDPAMVKKLGVVAGRVLKN